jgi:hypothetical protein
MCYTKSIKKKLIDFIKIKNFSSEKKNEHYYPDVVVHTFNPSTQEAGARGS